MMPGAEGAAGLDDDDEASLGAPRLPRRDDEEPIPHTERLEMGSPRLRPAGVRDGRDTRIVDDAETQRANPAEIVSHLGVEPGGAQRGGKESPQPSGAAHLLFEDPEGPELPDEVGKTFADVLRC